MQDDLRAKANKQVVSRIMETVENYDKIGKEEFVSILRLVMEEVHRNTAIDVEEIAAATEKVIEAMPREYGQLSKRQRSRPAMIDYLYVKYLDELGVS